MRQELEHLNRWMDGCEYVRTESRKSVDDGWLIALWTVTHIFTVCRMCRHAICVLEPRRFSAPNV